MPEDRKTNVNNLTIVWQGQSWSVITPKGSVIFRSVDKREAFDFAKDNFQHVSVSHPTDDYLDKDFKEFEPLLRKKKTPKRLALQQEMDETNARLKHRIKTGQISKKEDMKDRENKNLEDQLRKAKKREINERKVREKAKKELKASERKVIELENKLENAKQDDLKASDLDKLESRLSKAKERELAEREERKRTAKILEERELEIKRLEGELRESQETHPFELNEPDPETLDGFLQIPVANLDDGSQQKRKRMPGRGVLRRINWKKMRQVLGILIATGFVLFLLYMGVSFVASVGIANILIFIFIVGSIILATIAFLRYMFESGVLTGIFGVLLLLGSCGLCMYLGLLPF